MICFALGFFFFFFFFFNFCVCFLLVCLFGWLSGWLVGVGWSVAMLGACLVGVGQLVGFPTPLGTF